MIDPGRPCRPALKIWNYQVSPIEPPAFDDGWAWLDQPSDTAWGRSLHEHLQLTIKLFDFLFEKPF